MVSSPINGTTHSTMLLSRFKPEPRDSDLAGTYLIYVEQSPAQWNLSSRVSKSMSMPTHNDAPKGFPFLDNDVYNVILYAYIHIHLYIYAYIYLCTYIYICIINIHEHLNAPKTLKKVYRSLASKIWVISSYNLWNGFGSQCYVYNIIPADICGGHSPLLEATSINIAIRASDPLHAVLLLRWPQGCRFNAGEVAGGFKPYGRY